MKYWKEENDCCSWDGVTCDTTTGYVIGLHLSCSLLYGDIPLNNSLFLLPHLRNLSLAFNDFNYSQISPGFSQFPCLKLLDLSNSNFTGPILASLGNLSQLTHLDLSSNSFSPYHIPTSLSSLKQLRYLNLQGNDLIGKIPDIFANLTQLSYLDFSKNQLNGSIPLSLSGLRNLATIDLSDNFLQGIIPSWLFTLPSLQYINLGQNQLIGPIPSSLFELENLTWLSLSSNNLSGNVELNMFTKFQNLEVLDLSHNSLSVSTTVKANSSISKLYDLRLSSCNVSEFPNILRPLDQLWRLDLSDNKIHGRIPNWMWDVGKETLYYLDLSHNFLTGIELIPWNNLDFLYLQFNRLQGSLPAPPPSISFFYISNNKLTGEIPSSFFNIVTLLHLDLSENNLSGRIPENLGSPNAPFVLNLRRNKFHGPIPQTFGNGCSLGILNLNGNQLEGPMPPSLVNCSHLRVLDVGNNMINDTFPHWLTTLSHLQVVILRSNRFHGPIGSSKIRFSFTELRILDLSRNQFSGVLSTVYFKNFEAMMHGDYDSIVGEYIKEFFVHDYYSAVLTLKGNDRQMDKIQTIFTIIDLSSNRFQGEIPQVFGKLISLQGLNISHNSLTGPIPPSFGNLNSLEFLDVSSNKLVGEIPWELTSLNFLQVLNLSYNQLEGPIPRVNHFDTFPNDSYIGNSGLCGFPLSRECPSVETPQSIPIKEDDSESESGFGWKAVLIGYACGMVFGVFIAYVAISTGKPRLLAKIAKDSTAERWDVRITNVAMEEILSTNPFTWWWNQPPKVIWKVVLSSWMFLVFLCFLVFVAYVLIFLLYFYMFVFVEETAAYICIECAQMCVYVKTHQ